MELMCFLGVLALVIAGSFIFYKIYTMPVVNDAEVANLVKSAQKECEKIIKENKASSSYRD